MTGATVAAGFVRGLLRFTSTRGANRDALMERAQLAREELQDPDSRVPLEKFVRLMHEAKTACSDPALALHYAEAVDIAEASLLGLIGGSSETMTDALAQLNRYVRLAVDIDMKGRDRFQLKHRADGVWLVDERADPNDFPELTEWTLAQLVCWARRRGDLPIVRAVHVTHLAPPYRGEYDRIFRVPITFGSNWNALLTEEGWLAQKVAVLPRYVLDVMTARADALVKELDQAKTTRGTVESLLAPVLHTGAANMEAIAAKMGLSRQALLRRLKAEGATFETVLDELRRKLALSLLGDEKISVNETAYLVGFSDPAAFSRAFKRWTGKSPRDARGARP